MLYIKIMKLTVILFTILLISNQQQKCLGQINMATIAISGTTGIYSYIFAMQARAREAQQIQNILDNIDYVNEDIRDSISFISNIVRNELPKEINLMKERDTLQKHFDRIEHIFKKSLIMHKSIIDHENVIEDKMRFKKFVDTHEQKLWDSIYEIHRIVLNDHVATYLTGKFMEDLLKFENVCVTGMSQLQFIDNLWESITMATAEYYITRKLMYAFLEFSEGQNHETSMELVHEEVMTYAEQTAEFFKDKMAHASRDLYTCDPQKGYTASTFAEIEAFSKYLYDEHTNAACSKGQFTCEKAYQIIPESCAGDRSKVCESTRKCRNSLQNCKRIAREKPKICVNGDPNAKKRYSSIILHEEDESKYRCTMGTTEKLYTPALLPFTSGFQEICRYCDCICNENYYYVSTQDILADTSNNRVVTGAKLTVEDSIIYIQIQEGQLLPNGSINSDTLKWLPVQKPTDSNELKQISWDGLREVDLTETEISTDNVLTGLKFHVNSGNRMSLSVFYNKFNFRTGKLEGSPKPKVPEPGTVEFKLDNCDVPTKSRKSNIPKSLSNQYVKFTTTDMIKDGGQSVIPYIDIQKVQTDPSTILSGAGLIIRNQEGFGGFLTLKLITYDVLPYTVKLADWNTFEVIN